MATAAPKRGTDWVEARDFWLALPPPRSSQPVADKYRVSRTRVNFVRKRDNWDAIARKLDAKALAAVERRVLRSRQERNDAFLALYDKMLDRLAAEVEKPDAAVRFGDVPQYGKHAELILGEATERVDQAEVQEALGVVMQVAVKHMPREAQPAFLAEVRERLGRVGGDE